MEADPRMKAKSALSKAGYSGFHVTRSVAESVRTVCNSDRNDPTTIAAKKRAVNEPNRQ